jgi:hypothetical protein
LVFFMLQFSFKILFGWETVFAVTALLQMGLIMKGNCVLSIRDVNVFSTITYERDQCFLGPSHPNWPSWISGGGGWLGMFLLEVVKKTPIFSRFARKDVQRRQYRSNSTVVETEKSCIFGLTWPFSRAQRARILLDFLPPPRLTLAGRVPPDGETQ